MRVGFLFFERVDERVVGQQVGNLKEKRASSARIP